MRVYINSGHVQLLQTRQGVSTALDALVWEAGLVKRFSCPGLEGKVLVMRLVQQCHFRLQFFHFEETGMATKEQIHNTPQVPIRQYCACQ